jgi:DNA-binding transcriptional LysR family regulator
VNLSSIDLNLLWMLHAVLEDGSVTAAAARLHVTAPAVSNALTRLRGVLDDPLFVRKGRGLAPTPRTLELAPALARAFADISTSLARHERFDPKTCTRQLTVALSDADQIASLPAITRAFARRLPRARMRVVSLDTLVSEGGLAGGTVDVAIGPPPAPPEHHYAKAYEEKGIMIARRGHPRIKRKLTTAAFNTERHIDLHLMLGRAGEGHKLAEDAFAQAGLVRDVAVVVPTFFAAAAVVAATDYLSGMPLRVARSLRRSLPIEVLTGPGPPLEFELGLHWHERTHKDPAAEAFRGLILEALRGSAG